MNFSDRYGPRYVTLGPGVTRRSVALRDAAASPIERFLGNRMHGFSTIVRIEVGSGCIRGSCGPIEVGAGDVLLLPPGPVAYAFRGPRRVEILAVAESDEAGVVVREHHLPSSLFEREPCAIVAALRDAPARCNITWRDAERTAMRALARIDEQRGAGRLSQVAHELGYTSGGLTNLLQRTTGLGFARWRDALLMAHVRAKLLRGAPVVRAARDLRLDATYVHRRFAAAHGATPRRWCAAPALPPSARAHQWDTLVRLFDGARPTIE